MARRIVLVGHPVRHSLSPVFQQAAMRAAGLDAVYEAVDVPPEALAGVIAQLRADRAAGNVTVPHKAQVAALCDRLTPLAARVGAVNTFWTSDAQLVGDNTDVEGFDRAARRVLPDAATNITVGVLGAGGAAAGVLAAIEQWPSARVLIWNRTRDRAESLAARFGSVAKYSDVDEIACTADLVVNATTVGMREGDPVPIDVATLRRATTVMDLVYRRSGDDTPLVRAARGRGLAACDGLPMLLEQGALAFERWFGFAPDRAAMEQSISLAR